MDEPSQPAPLPLDSALIGELARRLTRPVVLVGLMGVGKSSVGRRLAQALGAHFTDADDAIEDAAQLTIPEIFDLYGEAYFRDGERRVIARLIAEDSRPPGLHVIATGGGAFVNAETRALILDRAVAVWLDADLDLLVERTGRKGNRPLLRQGDPRATLARLQSERSSAYAEAPVHVVSPGGPHHRTMMACVRGLIDWLDAQTP